MMFQSSLYVFFGKRSSSFALLNFFGKVHYIVSFLGEINEEILLSWRSKRQIVSTGERVKSQSRRAIKKSIPKWEAFHEHIKKGRFESFILQNKVSSYSVNFNYTLCLKGAAILGESNDPIDLFPWRFIIRTTFCFEGF